jgi:hypothetical protein
VIQLGYSEHGQWTVLPTDPDWHPDWTVYDGLPSGRLRRVLGEDKTGPMQWDSIRRIPGDSIDIRFPSALGILTVRLGEDGGALGGRAEWVVRLDQYFLNEGVRVRAWRASCEELRLELKRTRSKWTELVAVPVPTSANKQLPASFAALTSTSTTR